MTTFTKTGGVQSPRMAGGASSYHTPNLYPYLVITDGTTTVTFQSGAGTDTNYPLHRQVWAPILAGLRVGQLGGRTPYEDVIEEFVIQVRGPSADHAYSRLATLGRLLEQAERWARGENVAAVIIKFCPKGAMYSSVANPLQATILGRANGDETVGLSLTGEWNAAGTHYVIPAVKVRFKRRGLWLANTENSVTSAAASNGDLVTVPLAATNDPSPTRIDLTNVGYGKSALRWYHGGFLIIGEGSEAVIAVLAAENGTGTGYTSVSDSARNARNTNVLRYTPSGTTEVRSGDIATAVGGANLPSATNLVAVYLNVRPHTSTSFTIRVQVGGLYQSAYTPLVAIPAEATTYPRWVFLGLVASNPSDHLYLLITASAASGTLDIDSVVVTDARLTQAIALVQAPSDDLVSASDYGDFEIDHELLALPAPTAMFPDILRVAPYKGDLVVMTQAGTIQAMLLASGGGTGTDGDEWRQAEYVGDAVLTNAWTIYRRTGYPVAQ